MLLSIIIPVYNVENYVETCIESVLACDLSECEIILVLGHSTDKSNIICEEFVEKNENIKILMQEDTGLSDARNCGMAVAEGKYITFIDSDDFVDSVKFNKALTMLRELKDEPIEVFVSDYNMVDSQGRIVSKINQIADDEDIKDYSYLETFLSHSGCFWNVWRYIYSKEFLEKNGFLFKVHSLSEDIDYTIRVLMKVQSIRQVHNPYYQYRVGREQSLMNISNFKRVDDTVTIIKESIEEVKKNDEIPFCFAVINHLTFEWLLNMAVIFEVPKIDRKRTKEVFVRTKHLLKESNKPVQRIAYFTISAVGIMLIAYGLHLLKIMKRRVKRIKMKLRKEKIQDHGLSKDVLEV